jgi:hypothetical protein
MKWFTWYGRKAISMKYSPYVQYLFGKDSAGNPTSPTGKLSNKTPWWVIKIGGLG